jgi:hypothetical protein
MSECDYCENGIITVYDCGVTWDEPCPYCGEEE